MSPLGRLSDVWSEHQERANRTILMHLPSDLSIIKAVQAVLSSNARQAVVYESPTLIVKATRQFRADKRNIRETILLTVGRPAFRQAQFVKACKKAGEPFPVKKVQLRYWPKKK